MTEQESIATRFIYFITGIKEREVVKRIESIIAMVLITAFICGTFPVIERWSARDEVTTLNLHYARYLDPTKIIKDGKFVFNGEFFVVGTPNQYPADLNNLHEQIQFMKTSLSLRKSENEELAKQIKDLKSDIKFLQRPSETK